MRKRFCAGLLVVIAAVALLASCAPAAETTTTTTTTAPPTSVSPTTSRPTTPSAEAPKYGGVLRVALGADITSWDGVVTSFAVPGATYGVTNDPIWYGDWAKGPGGGYGTNDTDWGGHFDLWFLNTGRTAEKWSWKVDADGKMGTIVYTIRQGVKYGLNPASEASRLVNGRQMTADDVVFSLTQLAKDPRSYVARSNQELNAAEIKKTGPWEVSVRLAVDAMVTAICRLGMYGRVEPPEVVQKYGGLQDWRNSVGTGPFMLTDYVGGSVATLRKNPNYYGKDSVGPGKGSQLPYIDEMRYLIIPDASTREAAMRTGKIDWYGLQGDGWETAELLTKSAPAMKSALGTIPHAGEIQLRTDKPPFNDPRVRRAMMMATDFQSIHKSLNNGVGQIQTWPFPKVKGYEDLYISIDDPEIPESTRELYKYNPEKAKQLLAEAGYPNGFKITALLNPTEVDYYSILVDMWSKVGVTMTLDVKEAGVVASIQRAHKHPEATVWGGSPVAIFYIPPTLYGSGANMSELNDPVILESLKKQRLDALTDLRLAMKDMRELTKHLLAQAYHIPRPKRNPINLWWPWLKNYSGEAFVSYGTNFSWAEFIWLDQDLKKSMGY